MDTHGILVRLYQEITESLAATDKARARHKEELKARRGVKALHFFARDDKHLSNDAGMLRGHLAELAMETNPNIIAGVAQESHVPSGA